MYIYDIFIYRVAAHECAYICMLQLSIVRVHMCHSCAAIWWLRILGSFKTLFSCAEHRSLLKGSFGTETYIFKKPTNRSHPVDDAEIHICHSTFVILQLSIVRTHARTHAHAHTHHTHLCLCLGLVSDGWVCRVFVCGGGGSQGSFEEMYESCHAHVVSHITDMNASCHTDDRNESCHTYECVVPEQL